MEFYKKKIYFEHEFFKFILNNKNQITEKITKASFWYKFNGILKKTIEVFKKIIQIYSKYAVFLKFNFVKTAEVKRLKKSVMILIVCMDELVFIKKITKL